MEASKIAIHLPIKQTNQPTNQSSMEASKIAIHLPTNIPLATRRTTWQQFYFSTLSVPSATQPQFELWASPRRYCQRNLWISVIHHPLAALPPLNHGAARLSKHNGRRAHRPPSFLPVINYRPCILTLGSAVANLPPELRAPGLDPTNRGRCQIGPAWRFLHSIYIHIPVYMGRDK